MQRNDSCPNHNCDGDVKESLGKSQPLRSHQNQARRTQIFPIFPYAAALAADTWLVLGKEEDIRSKHVVL